jgi:nucleotide-binding universal stress UspA family protein
MYKQIVVGTDGSAGANVAVEAAMELARLTGARLHVVTAHKATSPYQIAGTPEIGIPMEAVIASNEVIHADAQKLCDDVAVRATNSGVDVETHCVPGDAADVLLRVAEDAQCDLVVVGNRGMTGVRRFVLGSVPNRLSHHCPTNLLIVDTASARG